MRLAWLTDVHLGFVPPARVRELGEEVRASGAEAVVITGDIGEAHDVDELLEVFAHAFGATVYFVLGNHDFYGSSVGAVRARMERLGESSRRLRWLPACGVVPLAPGVALVGHDGWGDARAGAWATTRVDLADFYSIRDLAFLPRNALIAKLRALGDEAGSYLRDTVTEALDAFDHVVVATHVPPFEEACWHEGRLSDPEWLPYFTCVAAGEALRESIARHPGKRLTVLCGHTHGAGECTPYEGVTVWTGGAQYGHPRLDRVLELG